MSSHRGESEPEDDVGLDTLLTASPTHVADRRQPVGILIGAACTLVVVLAFSIGAVVSVGNGSDSPASGGRAASAATLPDSLAAAALGKRSLGGGAESPTDSSSSSASPSPTDTHTGNQPGGGELTGAPYAGALAPVHVVNTSATCVASPGVDGGGNTVTYRAGNMLDDDPTTAWRCDGDGRGVTLSLLLGDPTTIVAVGLIPGYAKTDPYDHIDRYAENRRISKVRWTFGGGNWIEQTLSTDPKSRRLQTLRIPKVTSDRVTLEILDSVPGSRDTVAISAVELATAS
ncbi:MAG: hypothetical protein ABJA86_06295 [Nocardioidaceae bacterium]